MTNDDLLPLASVYGMLQDLSSRLSAQLKLNAGSENLQEVVTEIAGLVDKLSEIQDKKHLTHFDIFEAKRLIKVVVDKVVYHLKLDEALGRKQVWIGAYKNRHTDPFLISLEELAADLLRYFQAGMPVFPRSAPLKNGPREEILPQIEEIVPGQVVAPARFDFVEQVLHVQHEAADPEEDAEIANAALGALLTSGARILEKLKESNCDSRLTETVEIVQKSLKSKEDIIALGILNIEYRAIGEEFEEELPKAINALLRAHASGIESYLGQFPSWRKYSENAASIHLSSQDIDKLHSIAAILTTALNSCTQVVSNEVPEAIQFLNRLLKEPKVATKQVAFALIRTIQNLTSKVFHYGAAFLDDLITKTSKGTASTLSKVAIIGLVGLVVDTVFGLSPIAGKIAEAGWMKEAAELIKAQLELIKN